MNGWGLIVVCLALLVGCSTQPVPAAFAVRFVDDPRLVPPPRKS